MVVSDVTQHTFGQDWTFDEVRQFVRHTYNRDAILRTILNFAGSQMTRRAVLILGSGTVQAQCTAEWQNMPEEADLRRLRAKLPDDAAITQPEITEGSAAKLGLLPWFETIDVAAPSHIVCVPFPIAGRVAIVLIGTPRPELSHAELTELGITAGLQLETVIKMAKTNTLPPEEERIPPVPPSVLARQRGDANESSQFPFAEAKSEHSEHSHSEQTPEETPQVSLAEPSAAHHTVELEDFAAPAPGRPASDTIRGFQPAQDASAQETVPAFDGPSPNATAFGLPAYSPKAHQDEPQNPSSTVFGLPLVSDESSKQPVSTVEENLEASSADDVKMVQPQEIGNEHSGAGRTLMGGLDVLDFGDLGFDDEPEKPTAEPPQAEAAPEATPEPAPQPQEAFVREPSVNATLLGGIAPVEALEASEPTPTPEPPPAQPAGPPAAMIFRTAKFTKRKTSPNVQALAPEPVPAVEEPAALESPAVAEEPAPAPETPAAGSDTLLITPEPVVTPEPAPETPIKRPPPLPTAASARPSKQTQQLDATVGSNTLELGSSISNSTMMGMPVANKPLATDDWLREFAEFEEWNKAKPTEDAPAQSANHVVAREPSEAKSEAKSEASEALDKLLASTPIEVDVQEAFLMLDSRDKTVAFKAAADVAAAGPIVLEGLTSMFPGRLFIDRYQFTYDTLPVISDHGPILRALVRIGDPSLSVVRQFINDTSLEARFYAVMMLTQLSAATLLAELVPRIFDRDQQIRQLARNIVLAYQNAPHFQVAVVAPLRERLSLAQDDLHVEIAADLLARMKDLPAIPMLMDQLGKHREHTNRAIHQALQQITLHNWSSPYEWKQWWTNAQAQPRHAWLVAAMDAQSDTLRQLAHEELQRLPGLETAYHPEQPAKLRQREQRLVEKWFSDRA